MTTSGIACGEIDPPKELISFLCLLITREGNLENISERASRYIQSTAADLIFQTSRGMIKPAKHLLMGMGMKSHWKQNSD